MTTDVLYHAAALAVDTTKYKIFSPQAWAQAGKTTLLGMVAVFTVLTIIMLVVMLMGKIFGVKNNVTPVAADPVPEEILPETAADNDEEIAAAITAAISAYLASEEGYTGAFRVVSFKKANTKSAWNKQ